MRKRKNLVGQVFGRLAVIQPDPTEKYFWVCKCECGNTKVVKHWWLTSGNTKSCGCLLRETTTIANRVHGMSESKLYGRWKNMRRRCSYPKSTAYRNYGGRGIKVCDEWMNSFESFRKWSEVNGYDESLELDRIDNDGNYEPSNCRWTSKEVNSWNKRTTRKITINGNTRTIKEWSETSGIRREILEARIHYGWTGDKLLKPVIPRTRKGKKHVPQIRDDG